MPKPAPLPRDGTPITLLAIEADSPLDYCFEVDQWQSVTGATRQLQTLFAQLKKSMHGELLYADDARILAIYRTQAEAERTALEAQKQIAAQTGILTLTIVIETLPAQMLYEGRFPAPVRVVGVPGVSPYQARINRYYGAESPYTVPTAEQLATRRHFGQVMEWMHGRILQKRQQRDVFPFYELLPFAEPCPLCRIRPIEQGDHCLVCTKRIGQESDKRQGVIVVTRLHQFEKQLVERRTPEEYAALYTQVQKAYEKSVQASGLTPLFTYGEYGILTTESGGLPLALSLFASTYPKDNKLPGLYIGVGFGDGSPGALWKAAQNALSATLRGNDPTRIGLQPLHQLSATFYQADTLIALQNAIERLRSAHFPADVYTELAAQIARGTASLYYGYGRMRLEAGILRLLDTLESEWGRESARYFRALHDALALARLTGE